MILIEGSGFKLWVINEELEKKLVETMLDSLNLSKLEEVEERGEVENEGENIGWVKLTKLSAYKKIGDVIVFAQYDKRIRKYSPIAKFTLDELRDLYEELPDKATKDDIFSVSKKLNIDIPSSYYHLLLHFFGKDINYNAHVERQGHAIMLVKDEFSLSEDVKKQLEVDKELTKDAVR